MPAARPPFMSLVKESPHDQHVLFVKVRQGGKDLVEESHAGFFGPQLLGEEDSIHPRPQAGAGELLRLGHHGAVGHHVLPHPAVEGLDQVQAVVPVDDRVPQGQLEFGVEGFGKVRFQTQLREKLPKPARQHLLLGDLPPLQALPVPVVEVGVPGRHLVRTHAQSKFTEQPLDGGLLRRQKIQQRSIHIPKDRPYRHRFRPFVLFPIVYRYILQTASPKIVRRLYFFPGLAYTGKECKIRR